MIATKQDLYDIATSKNLTYQQKMYNLANASERLFDPIELLGYTKKDLEYIENGKLCDLNEGYAVYRPRYIVPDYSVFVQNGCKFLDLPKPKTLDDLLDGLLILYSHVPSITSFPVFIGFLDQLIEPFLQGEEDLIVYPKIKRFLNHIDKTITDSFCHADIGPVATRAGYLILKAIIELKNPTPNMTVMYDPKQTDEKFALACVDACLRVSKPSFSNFTYYTNDMGEHALCSCYNALPLAGGAFSLMRFRLGTLVKDATTLNDFVNKILVNATESILHMSDQRIKFIVEKSYFFETNFLVKEGFIKKENFTSMIAIVGLSDAVNYLLKQEGLNETFGQSKRGDEMGHAILTKIETLVNAHKAKYVNRTNNHYVLHAQVGASILEADKENTPAHRIKVGEEPILPLHLNHAAQFHKYFPSGTGDLFAFDQTSLDHLDAVLDIIKGAFKQGMRYITTYLKDTDLIRVTGYLVKKSEIEKANKNETVLRDTTWFGKGTQDNADVFNRRRRYNDSNS